MSRIHRRDKSYCDVCGEFEVSGLTECVPFRQNGTSEAVQPVETVAEQPNIYQEVAVEKQEKFAALHKKEGLVSFAG